MDKVLVPIEACLFWPTIMAHSTMAAPELSMQLSIDCPLSASLPFSVVLRSGPYLELNHLVEANWRIASSACAGWNEAIERAGNPAN